MSHVSDAITSVPGANASSFVKLKIDKTKRWILKTLVYKTILCSTGRRWRQSGHGRRYWFFIVFFCRVCFIFSRWLRKKQWQQQCDICYPTSGNHCWQFHLHVFVTDLIHIWGALFIKQRCRINVLGGIDVAFCIRTGHRYVQRIQRTVMSVCLAMVSPMSTSTVSALVLKLLHIRIKQHCVKW